MAKQPDRVLGPGAKGDVEDPGELVAPKEAPPKKKTESKEDDK